MPPDTAEWVKVLLGSLGLGTAGGWLGGFLRVRDRFQSVEHRVDTLETSAKSSKGALEESIKELKKELELLKEKMEKDARASLTAYASAAVMQELQRDQEERWREINRTLGKIEGILQATP